MKYAKDLARHVSDVDVTSLIDMMFLLLIFFMVTTSFQEDAQMLGVTLPHAANPRVVTLDEKVLKITIGKDNRIFVGDKEVAPGELKQDLTRALKERASKQVLISGDGETRYQNIISVIDMLTMLQVEGVSFAVLYQSL